MSALAPEGHTSRAVRLQCAPLTGVDLTYVDQSPDVGQVVVIVLCRKVQMIH
jgi:hypothetical protein